MNRPTAGIVINTVLGLLVVYVIHSRIIPEIDFAPTAKFIFAMEKLALILVASAFVFGEIRKYSGGDRHYGLTLRDVGVLLVAIAGSGLLYIGLLSLSSVLHSS